MAWSMDFTTNTEASSSRRAASLPPPSPCTAREPARSTCRPQTAGTPPPGSAASCRRWREVRAAAVGLCRPSPCRRSCTRLRKLVSKLPQDGVKKMLKLLLPCSSQLPVRYVRASSGTSSYSSRNIWICRTLILRSDSLNS